jgi:alkanesulfonate monooxygenase SsuD/methylene tetrahydromethanopterin reductase-like flavin-dependent oxidoreductase (luciferase family)
MLVRGEPTRIDGQLITLAPGAPMPPVLIGGGPATLRRAARFGDEWYPAFSSPSAIAAGAARLAELAADLGRPTPRLTVGVGIGLGSLPAAVIDEQIASLTAYGMTDEEARAAVVTGSPAQAAERLASLAAIGVHRIVGMPFAGDRLRQSELLAEAARLANP